MTVSMAKSSVTKTTDVDSWLIGRCLERVVRPGHGEQLCDVEQEALLSVPDSGHMNRLAAPAPLASHPRLDRHEYCFRPALMNPRRIPQRCQANCNHRTSR